MKQKKPLSSYVEMLRTMIAILISLIIVFFDKKIKVWEVVGFYVIYIIYVLVGAARATDA